MSFNKLKYDTCSYKQVLEESTGPGEYQLASPHVSCEPCFNKDPRFRLQKNGVSLNTRMNMIDTDSELMNITRSQSNCSEKKFNPKFNNAGNIENPSDMLHLTECQNLTTEDTRLSNPPCTLRGTGWNRWEWLCQDPQERVLIPFDYEIDTRNNVRDNHRPCIPEPLDPSESLPSPTNEPIMNNIEKVKGVPTGPPSVQWRSIEEIRNY